VPASVRVSEVADLGAALAALRPLRVVAGGAR
jgi:hypothetical protein